MTTEHEAVELFLQTITNDITLKVIKINEKREIRFSVFPESLEQIRLLFSDPTLIKDFLLVTDKIEGGQPVDNLENNDNVSRVLSLTGQQIIEILFVQEFLDSQLIFNTKKLKEQGINCKIYENKLTKQTIFEFSADDLEKLKLIVDCVEHIQSNFKNSVKIANSLFNNKAMVLDDVEDAEIKFETEIFYLSINEQNKEITLVFNFGQLIRDVSQYDPVFAKIPVISVIDYGLQLSRFECILNLDQLLLYMHQIDPNGLILRNEANGKIRPIAHHPILNSAERKEVVPEFLLLIDRSFVNEQSFNQYRNKIYQIIDLIDQNTNHNWIIRLFFLNHSSYEIGPYSYKNDGVQEVKNAIKAFHAEGGIDIYIPLNVALRKAKNITNPNIILFTYGENNNSNLASEELLKTLKEVRAVNSQLSLYIIGFRNSNMCSLFDSLESVDAKQIYLNSFNEVSDFSGALKTIAKFKVIYEFISMGVSQQIQCPEGSVAIFDKTISKDSEIIIKGYRVNIQDLIIERNKAKQQRKEVDEQETYEAIAKLFEEKNSNHLTRIATNFPQSSETKKRLSFTDKVLENRCVYSKQHSKSIF